MKRSILPFAMSLVVAAAIATGVAFAKAPGAPGPPGEAAAPSAQTRRWQGKKQGSGAVGRFSTSTQAMHAKVIKAPNANAAAAKRPATGTRAKTPLTKKSVPGGEHSSSTSGIPTSSHTTQ